MVGDISQARRYRETGTIQSSSFSDSQGLQSIPVPRLPINVDRRLHVQYWNLDAKGCAELVDLSDLQFSNPAGAGRVPGRYSYFSVFTGRWCAGGPHRAPPPFAGLAVHADELCVHPHVPGRLSRRAGLAHSGSLIHFRCRAGIRRTGLCRAHPHPGGQGGHAQRYRAELDSVQRRGNNRAGAGGAHPRQTRRDLVLCDQRHFLPGAHHLPQHAAHPLPAGKDQRVHHSPA